MSQKVKIVSDRIVGYKVGSRVAVDDLEAAGINVRQWLRCGLAELVQPARGTALVGETGPELVAPLPASTEGDA